MKVKVKLFDTLRKFAPVSGDKGEFVLNLSLEATVSTILRICGLPEDKITVIMVNGSIMPPGTILKEEDEVAIFPSLTDI